MFHTLLVDSHSPLFVLRGPGPNVSLAIRLSGTGSQPTLSIEPPLTDLDMGDVLVGEMAVQARSFNGIVPWESLL